MVVGVSVYVRGSIEAAALYREAFGLTLGYHVLDPRGGYYHSELLRDGEEALCVIEQHGAIQPGGVVCLGITMADEAALRRAFALLREGGTVKREITSLPWSPCCAEVLDRYGVWWYLTVPQHLPPEDFDPAEHLD